jgi:hypothetical protein
MSARKKRIQTRQMPREGSLRRRTVKPGEMERVAVWLSRELGTRLRVYAAEHRMAISVAVEQALARYLDSGRP